MSDITKADKVYVSTSKNGDYVSAINDEDSVTFIRADLVIQLLHDAYWNGDHNTTTGLGAALRMIQDAITPPPAT